MRALSWAKRAALLLVLVIGVWITISPIAFAPAGDRFALGGRTIASVQEEEFDKKLERFQHCYGIRFSNRAKSIDRRRTCKAIAVRQIQSLLKRSPSSYFESSIRLECSESPHGPLQWKDWDDTPVLALRLNRELDAFATIKDKYWIQQELAPEQIIRAEAACDRVVYCQKVIRWSAVSPLEAMRCLADKDSQRRRIMVDLVARQLFKVSSEHSPVANEFLATP